MKKNTIIKITISTIVLIAIVVGGWIFLQPDNKTAPVINNPKPTETSTAQPTEPTPTSTSSTSYEEFSKEQQKISGVDEIDFFSKEDVNEVLVTAQKYANASLTNTYFLSGKWITDGHPMDQLDNTIGQYYAEPIREKIRTLDVATATTKDILPLVFYVGDTGEVSPSPICKAITSPEEVNKNVGKEATMACPMTDVTVSEMKYSSKVNKDNDNVLSVQFTASTKVPVVIDKTIPAFTDVTYTYDLEFIANPYYDEVTNPNKFVIAGYNTTAVAEKVEAINNG